MPEGDTIHRIAARVAPGLTGKQLERVTTQGLIRNLAGRKVTSVAPHGKHLVIDLDDGTYLRIHLGMNGRFRAYGRADGEAVVATTSPGRASLVIATAELLFLWLTAPTVEISHRRSPRHGMAVATLGPDILTDAFDCAAVARSVEHDARAIANVLLDQHVAAGIGNVYKCEALFTAGIDPRTPAAALGLAKLDEIYRIARTQMLANLGPGPRTTRAHLAQLSRTPGEDRYFVYSRTGKPCLRCSAKIECYSLGEPARWTWSCPTCQVVPEQPGLAPVDPATQRDIE